MMGRSIRCGVTLSDCSSTGFQRLFFAETALETYFVAVAGWGRPQSGLDKAKSEERRPISSVLIRRLIGWKP